MARIHTSIVSRLICMMLYVLCFVVLSMCLFFVLCVWWCSFVDGCLASYILCGCSLVHLIMFVLLLIVSIVLVGVCVCRVVVLCVGNDIVVCAAQYCVHASTYY